MQFSFRKVNPEEIGRALTKPEDVDIILDVTNPVWSSGLSHQCPGFFG